MKRISADKRWAGIVTVVVMSCHLLSGTGLFCALQFHNPAHGLGDDRTAPAVTGSDRGYVSASVWTSVRGKDGTFPCSCKKHKKCPAIPRATLTSNPTHRFNEIQRQLQSVCHDSLASEVKDHRFALEDGPPFMESVWCTPFYSFTPLAFSCVLLI